MLFQSSIVKVIEFILFYPEKLFTYVLPRLTLPYRNYAQAILSCFFNEIVIKSLIETIKVFLTFAALLPIETAVSGFKGEQRSKAYETKFFIFSYERA